MGLLRIDARTASPTQMCSDNHYHVLLPGSIACARYHPVWRRCVGWRRGPRVGCRASHTASGSWIGWCPMSMILTIISVLRRMWSMSEEVVSAARAPGAAPSRGRAVTRLAVVLGGLAALLLLPAAAFAGALITVVAIYAIAATGRGRGMATVLLVGIALNALLGAVVSALVANALDEQSLRGIVFWLQGDLDARTWQHVSLVLLPVPVGIAATLVFARDLNVMLLGDDAARTSGVNVARARHVLLVLASLLTGVAVAVSGVIGFVGLVAPHVIRLVAGPDHRLLLPAAALLGAIFLVSADTAARLLLAPVTLQAGVITAFVGAPVFLLLVLWSRRSTP
ncbi:hypothetical protein C1J01_12705 [Nonomuraea aridisoli]|uniref:Iron ABC transporter permease n=1 Tax=Nonomuraea aridisoli TaxID=2070368 RepID=A0A2W2ER97_9ACTN|nr:hypothetical protein C1J01_12705 [Nonomuraea aridisoli]